MSQNETLTEGYNKPSYVLTLELFFLLLLAITSLIGNVLVITVIYKSRRVQWLTNLFVAHLAGSNLLVPLLSAPVYLNWSLQKNWIIGSSMCRIVHFGHYVNCGVTILMLACMALDRYYVIVHPLSLHMGRSQTFQLITFSWTFAIFTSTPTLYFYNTITRSGVTRCDFIDNAFSWKGYIIAFTVVVFVIPLGITAVLYGIVIKTIVERNKCETHPLSAFLNAPICNQKVLGKVPHTKQKVVRMLIIQTGIFFFCWLPFYIRQFIESWVKLGSYELLVIAYWLAFANSACGPILYTATNGNFRRGCKHLCSLHLSKPYALSQVMHRKHQVDVLAGEVSHASNGKIPEYDNFYTKKAVTERISQGNSSKSFSHSLHCTYKEAWNGEENEILGNR